MKAAQRHAARKRKTEAAIATGLTMLVVLAFAVALLHTLRNP